MKWRKMAWPALWIVFAIGGWLVGTARPAMALGPVCLFTGPSLGLGVISPFTGFPTSTSGNIGVVCTSLDLSPANVYMCLSVSAAPTTLIAVGSSSLLSVQITGGAAWPSPIGDGTALPMAGPFAISVGALSTYTGTLPLAVKLLTPGSVPQPGIYLATFLGSDSQILYTTASSPPASCAALAAGSHAVAPAGFTVAATVLTQCTVSASSLTFPTRSLLTRRSRPQRRLPRSATRLCWSRSRSIMARPAPARRHVSCDPAPTRSATGSTATRR